MFWKIVGNTGKLWAGVILFLLSAHSRYELSSLWKKSKEPLQKGIFRLKFWYPLFQGLISTSKHLKWSSITLKGRFAFDVDWLEIAILILIVILPSSFVHPVWNVRHNFHRLLQFRIFFTIPTFLYIDPLLLQLKRRLIILAGTLNTLQVNLVRFKVIVILCKRRE